MGRVDHSSHHREENAFNANARLSSRAFFCLFRRDNMFVACDVIDELRPLQSTKYRRKR